MKRVFLITGFLGAGKTTLLKNLLGKFGDRTGLIVNEFGKTGFDGPLLKGFNTEMIELNNGSIFCSCLEPQFIESLVTMLGKQVETIFVESSGLSDPGRMSKALSEASIKSGIEGELTGIVTVIDLTRIVSLIDAFPVIRSQLEVADSIVANKSDLVTEEDLGKTVAFIERFNPGAKVMISSYCRLNPEQILSVRAGSHRSTWSGFDRTEKRQKKILLKFSEPVDFENFKAFIEEIAPTSLRIKGVISSSKGKQRLDCVGSDIRFYPTDGSSVESEIVMIFERGAQVLKRIKDSWHGKFPTGFFIG